MTHLSAMRESVVGATRLARRLILRRQDRYEWRTFIPTHCPLCADAANGGALCHRCHALVVRSIGIGEGRCPRCCLALDAKGQCSDCGANTPAFDRIIAGFDYCPPADFLIHRLKASLHFADAAPLGRLLADKVTQVWPDIPANLVLAPVPASAQAIARRGFNPAAEVARVVAYRLDRPYVPEMLQRVRGGHKQATLSREQRMMSTFRLYRVDANVRDVPVAVVDDVLTTGSTMHSIARLLKRSGALSVHGLVLGRTPRSRASLS